MNRFKKQKRLLSALTVLSCVALLEGTGLAQDSVIETLKRQLGEMQQQMQKMAERIEQLEREKSAGQTQSSQAEPLPSQSAPQAAAQPAATKGVSSAFNPAISVNGLFLGGASSSPRTTPTGRATRSST